VVWRWAQAAAAGREEMARALEEAAETAGREAAEVAARCAEQLASSEEQRQRAERARERERHKVRACVRACGWCVRCGRLSFLGGRTGVCGAAPGCHAAVSVQLR
jgi:hypothetical protein